MGRLTSCPSSSCPSRPWTSSCRRASCACLKAWTSCWTRDPSYRPSLLPLLALGVGDPRRRFLALALLAQRLVHGPVFNRLARHRLPPPGAAPVLAPRESLHALRP